MDGIFFFFVIFRVLLPNKEFLSVTQQSYWSPFLETLLFPFLYSGKITLVFHLEDTFFAW